MIQLLEAVRCNRSVSRRRRRDFTAYASQEFLAQSVALSLYRLGGHELPKEMLAKPFLKGIAEDVSFAVSGKSPQFKAKHFKAELNTLEEKK